MKSLKATLVTAVSLGLLGAVVITPPAQAADTLLTNGKWAQFNAYPEPVKRGGVAHLDGELYLPPIDDYTGVKVIFYFKKVGTAKYVRKGYDYAAYNGRFSKDLRQYASGTWKAVVWWTPKAKGPTKYDRVSCK